MQNNTAAAEHSPDPPYTLADRIIDLLGETGRHVALLAAWIAMCGSLYMSEVLKWTPCLLCWYQRILMYPLAIILAVGILRRDRGLHLYVLPLALLGAATSLYHYLLIKTNFLPPPACTSGIPCTTDYLNWFGFINVPFLALVAFLIISFMVSAAAVAQPPDETDDQNVEQRHSLDFARVATFVIIGVVVATFVIAGRFA